jgi:hypothetical protein
MLVRLALEYLAYLLGSLSLLPAGGLYRLEDRNLISLALLFFLLRLV